MSPDKRDVSFVWLTSVCNFIRAAMSTSHGFIILASLIVCHVIYAADINYLRSTITDHFSENRNHGINNDYKMAAKEFIYNEFKRFGLETTYHNFNYTAFSSKPFTNVIGILKGANFGNASDKIIGLGAHYDTVERTSGVDDNGSGVAAMLEVAKQLTDHNKQGMKRKNTIIFVSFDLEEQGLIGSEFFVKTWLNKWLTDNYGDAAETLQPHGIIILDTIMEYNTSSHSQEVPQGLEFDSMFPKTLESIKSDNYQGDFLAMIFRKDVDVSLATAMTRSWTAEKRPEFEFESFPLPFADLNSLDSTSRFLFRNFLRSDHTNFWLGNIPAVFLTDSANFRGDMIYCYHNPCDDLSTMLTDDNINLLAKTSDAIARSIDELSEPTKPDGSFSEAQSTTSGQDQNDTSGCVRVTFSHVVCVLMTLVLFVI